MPKFVKCLVISLCLSLFLVACSKKTSDEPIKAVAGPVTAPKPVDAPADVIAWLVAGNPQQFITAAEKMAAKAGPVPPGTMGMGINAGLVELGLKDTSVVDLSGPAGLLVLNPKKFKEPVVIAVTTKGHTQVVESMKPTWKLKSDEKGMHHFTREVLDTYAVFEGGKDAAAKKKEESLFIKFYGSTAVLGPDQQVLEAGADKLLERLKAGAPATGISGQMRLDHLRSAFSMEIAMFPDMIKQQMKMSMDQANGMAGMPDPKAMEWISNWMVDKTLAFFEQTKSVGMALGVDEQGALLHFTLEPEKDSFFAKFMAAQKKAPLKLDSFLPQDAFLAAAFNVQWKMIKADLLGFTNEIFKNLMGVEISKEWQEATEAFFEVFGEEIALVEDIGAGGELRIVEIIEVTDTAKAKAAMTKIMSLTSNLMKTAEDGIMGMRMSYEGPIAIGEHKGVALEEFKVKMDLSSLPEPQVKMMKKMYGEDGMSFVMAVFDKKMAIAIGKEGAQDLRQLIDRTKDNKAGLTASKSFVSAAGNLHKDAGGYMFLSLTRVISFGIQNTLAMTGGKASDLKLPQSTSGVFMRFGSDNGQLISTWRLPTAHLEEIGKTVQALSQLSSGAQ